MRKWKFVILIVIVLFPLVSLYGSLEAASKGEGEGEGEAFKEVVPPTASEIPVGHLIIGTYLIHRSALTNEIFAAASSTSQKNQVVYYKSELADGNWFDLGKSFSVTDITTANSNALVDESEINEIELKVWINENGQLIHFYKETEIDELVKDLKEKSEKLQEDYDEKMEGGQVTSATPILFQKKDIEAQIAFLHSLKNGEAEQAMEKLQSINNPQSVIEDLSESMEANSDTENEESEGSSASREKLAELAEKIVGKLKEEKVNEAKQTVETLINSIDVEETDEANKEITKQMLIQLIDQYELDLADDVRSAQILNELQLLLGQLINGKKEELTAAEIKQEVSGLEEAYTKAIQNDDGQAVHLLLELADKKADLAQLEEGVTEEIAGNQTAQDNLQLMIDSSEGEQLAQLQSMLETLKENRNSLKKKQLFIAKEVLDNIVLEVPLSIEAIEALEQEKAAIIEEIKQLESAKYAPDQLKKLEEEAKAAVEAGLEPLPVDAIISKELEIYLDAPPIKVGDDTYIAIRSFYESLGLHVVWMDGNTTATLTDGQNTIVIKIGSTTVNVNGVDAELELEPILLNFRTYVPLTFISENLGFRVIHYPKQETVQIEK